MWRTYGLAFGDEKLLELDKQLRDYGIHNKSELRFYRIFRGGQHRRQQQTSSRESHSQQQQHKYQSKHKSYQLSKTKRY